MKDPFQRNYVDPDTLELYHSNDFGNLIRVDDLSIEDWIRLAKGFRTSSKNNIVSVNIEHLRDGRWEILQRAVEELLRKSSGNILEMVIR